MLLSGSIFIISQWLLLDWCCIYKWKQIFFSPFNCQPCNLSLRFRSQLWDPSFWHITPSSSGLAELQGPHPRCQFHLPCCLMEGWCRRKRWEQSKWCGPCSATSSLLLVRRALHLKTVSSLTETHEGVSVSATSTGLSPLAGPHLPIIHIISKVGETANVSYSAEVQAGMLSLGSQSTCGYGEMAGYPSLSTGSSSRVGD